MKGESKKLLINSLEAVPSGDTVLRQAQHERENRIDLVPSSVHPELVEGWLASFSTASKSLRVWASRSDNPIDFDQNQDMNSYRYATARCRVDDARHSLPYGEIP
jgi:hypothetical protein